MTVYYELEVWSSSGYDYSADWIKQIEATVMHKSASPFVVLDEFGRFYTNFCSYRLALDAAVQARLMCDCQIQVYPIEVAGDIAPEYALVEKDNRLGVYGVRSSNTDPSFYIPLV